MDRADYTRDPRTIRCAVKLWEGGCYGSRLTYQEALALVNLRINVLHRDAFADDRAPAEAKSGD